MNRRQWLIWCARVIVGFIVLMAIFTVLAVVGGRP